MQRVTPGIRDAFGPVEEEIKTAFIPKLFHGVGDGAPGRAITRLPVKQAGLALPDPTRTAPENWQASCVITGHLVSALRGKVTFRTADHAACLWDVRAAVKGKSVANNNNNSYIINNNNSYSYNKNIRNNKNDINNDNNNINNNNNNKDNKNSNYNYIYINYYNNKNI